GDFFEAGKKLFQMLEVLNFEHNVHAGLAVSGLGVNVADVGFGVGHDCGDLLQHAEAVITEDREFYWIRAGRIVARPFDINAALRLIHEIDNIGTVHRVHGNAFPSRHVADHGLAANGITTSRAVNKKIAVSFYSNG